MLPTASDGDDGVLHWVQPMLQFQNEFVVECNQFISLTRGIKSGLFDVGDKDISQLMPHFSGVISLKLSDLALKLWELGLMLFENSCDFSLC